MPDDDSAPVQATQSGPTPTGYVRQANGVIVWNPPAPEELQGEFAQYQVLDLIARGGMGAVYRAWQTSLDRQVAIKILPRDLNDSDPSFVERFKREAKTMASLSHPAIIAVFDTGETPSGLLYFVMEYVDGTDVFQMLQQQGRLKTKHAVAITAHVCDALGYAHSHGVMHRDIKPANLMVDSEGRVRVADFGLAKSFEADLSLTRPDMGVGTPAYAAPEAFGIGLTTDHRSDLYSVGVVLYQMLTGVVPRGNFKPPSEVVPGVDPRFDAIVLRAMQTDPAERFQSAAELRAALDEIITAPLIQPGQESSPAVPKKEMGTVRRKELPVTVAKKDFPLAPVLAGLAVLLIAAGIVWWKVATMPEPGPRTEIGMPEPLVATAEKGGGARPLGAPLVDASDEGAAGATTMGAERTSAAEGGAERPKRRPPVAAVPAPQAPAAAEAPPLAAPPAKPEAPKAETVPAPPPSSSPEPKTAATPPAKPEAEAKPQAQAAPPNQQSKILNQQSQIPAPQSEPPPDPIAAIPELKQLHDQFLQDEAERVTAPFEAEVATLNAHYLAALERMIAGEKQAGHLAGVLALEEEKKRITGKQPLPEDGGQTAANLKQARAVYRDSLAKLEAKKGSNLKALTGPLAASLQDLESKLTKQDRIPEAKTVAEYRQRLAQSTAPVPPGEGAVPATPLATQLKIPRRDPALAEATPEKPFVNTVGMKFVLVKGLDGVLFCIHEVRYKDWAAYAEANPGIATNWKTQKHRGFTITERPEDHPVVYVSWEDAQGFCKWLSEKEGRTYRLPTDREWSIAVGLGRKEKWRKGDLPVEIKGDPDEFPWGRDWPPPKGAGNYSDESCKAKAPDPNTQYIDGYDDGYPTTAPVMSFKPNEFGLYDMGGNVWEWVEDWWNEAKTDRVLRGGGWFNDDRGYLLSSYRYQYPPRYRNGNYGFRVVVVVSGG